MTTEIFMVSGGGLVHVSVPPGEYLVGRGADADIHIDDPSVSSRHALLVVAKETVCIQDLDSQNGTFVEGEAAVGPTSLYDGQTAVLGTVSLRVRQNVDPSLLGDVPRYVRGGMVAFGGMGAIHEARQSAMGRKVAMKVMLHSWNASSVRRFLDEARITGMLEHPNIVPVHELGVDEEEQLFYTMKFVRGATLAEVLAGLSLGKAESAKKFPLTALLTIFQKVCDAVAFAHSRGVWHRDLKPENIMIGDFGEVLVMDWGLAKEAGFAKAEPATDEAERADTADEAAAPAMRTMEGSILGTPAYMSPEQARGATGEVDQRSDVYALGAILHEILHLQPPVAGESREEVLEKVAAGARDTPREHSVLHLPGHRVPASLEAVCRKAMDFDPGKRYQQVQDLQADLTAYQSGFATSAEGAGLGKHLALFIKRNRGVSLAAAAGLVALLASSVLFTINLVRERNRAEAAQVVAEKKAMEAKAALDKALAMEGQARSSDLKAEAAIGEREALRERYSDMSGSTEKAAAASAARARRMLAESRFEEALALVGNAAQIMPQSAEYLNGKANLLQSAGKFREAAESYRSVLALGDNAPARINLALTEKLLGIQGDQWKLKPEAVVLLEKALMEQRRELELVLLHAAAAGQRIDPAALNATATAAKDDERSRLAAKLDKFTKQSGWRTDRLKARPDGSWELDLSGLQTSDLTVLRGENIAALSLRNTDTAMLEGLIGLRLASLDLAGTPVKDLTPIRPMPLAELNLDGSKVENLEALRAMPLRKLRVACDGVEDFSPVSSLQELEELALPAHASGVDTGALTKLRTVEHPRYAAKGPISAEDFRKLSRETDEEMGRWLAALSACGAGKVPADRIKVAEGSLIDVDLRRHAVKDLAPLRDIRLRSLALGSEGPLDLSGLAGHPTLRHLDLSRVHLPKITPLLGNEALKSIVLSRTTLDAPAAAGAEHLERLGYVPDDSGLVPRSSKDEFFSPRRAEPEGATDAISRFDSPAKGDEGWRSTGGEPVLWQADPVPEGGRGGGFLAVASKPGAAGGTFFVAPSSLLGAMKSLYGGALDFQLRSSPFKDYVYDTDVVIEGDGKSLHFVGQIRPDSEWQSFVVPLREHPGWRLNGKDGYPVSEENFRRVLARADALRIRARFAGGDEGTRVAEIDEVILRTPAQAAEREEARERERLRAVDWGRGLVVKSQEALDRVQHAGLQGFRELGAVWLDSFDGRRGVLSVHPLDPQSPAVATFRAGRDVPEGSKLLITGRGTAVEPGVVVRVRNAGREIRSFAMNREWTSQEVPLPAANAAGAVYEVEVWPDGWNMEDAYFAEIALQLPDGSKEFSAATGEARVPDAPDTLAALNGPWIWDGPGLRTGIVLRNGRLVSNSKWTFQLHGRRLLVRIGNERAVELRQSADGNWHGVQHPERARVSMERVKPGQFGPTPSVSEMDGQWRYDAGEDQIVQRMKRGKSQVPNNPWKLKIEDDGSLRLEIARGWVVDFVPQEKGGWLGYDGRKGKVARFYPEK